MDRRDRLAELLSDDGVETLKDLAREGMAENSLRALGSDLAYLEAWADGATRQPLPWSATEALALKFVAHHLRDPSKRASDPRHGMPADVAQSLQGERLLRCDGPLPEHRQAAPGELEHSAPVERDRGTVCGAESALVPAIGRSRLAAAAPAQVQAGRHSGCLGSVDRDLRDGSSDRYRDLAILLLAFASGGRRCSEVARLRVEQLRDEPPARVDPRDLKSPTLPCLAIQLGQTKTGDADEEGRALLVGPPVEALRELLERIDITKGPISRAIDRWVAVKEKALTPRSIDLIVKRRCAMAGLEPGGVFRPRTARRISDRGGAARNRAAGGDAAVPAPLDPAGREPLQ